MSNLIVLVMQQPLKMFNLLISQFITGLCGCPAKIMKREQTCLDQVMIQMHLGMPNSHIFAEYCSWLKYPPTYSNSEQRANLYQWVCIVLFISIKYSTEIVFLKIVKLLILCTCRF